MSIVTDSAPTRVLRGAALLMNIGFGLYSSISLLYFTRVLNLPASGVGLAIGGAYLVGLASAPLSGRWADRLGPRDVVVAAQAVQAVLFGAVTGVRGIGGLVVLLVALMVAGSAANAGRAALISGLLGPSGRLAFLPYLQRVSNIGVAVGMVCASVVLMIDSSGAYMAAFWGLAATRGAAAVIHRSLPAVPGATRDHPLLGRLQALRDVPYLAVAQISGLVGLDGLILTLGLPVWLSTVETVPKAVIPCLMLLNTFLVIAFQVRASRGASDASGAGRMQKHAGIALAATCVILACVGWLSPWIGVTAVVAAVLILSFAEMWNASASWCLQVSLAPDQAQGAYAGAFTLGQVVPSAVGPFLIVELVERLGAMGWVLLGAGLLVISILTRPLINWAVRTRGVA